jgi:uncharacterized membrane protein
MMEPGETMETIEVSIDVACPITTVYDQWTRFEEYPRFMIGVESVDRRDDTHIHWRAGIWGTHTEWDAEIVEQVPNSRIKWRSCSGDTPNAGEAWFEVLPDNATRVHLRLRYDTAAADAAPAIGLDSVASRVRSTVRNFKNFIEKRAAANGASVR